MKGLLHLAALVILVGSTLTRITEAAPPASPLSSLARYAAALPIDQPSLVVIGAVDTKSKKISARALGALHTELLRNIASVVPLYRQRHESPLSEPEARTLARQKDLPLVYLQPRIDGTRLSLSASYIQWPSSFWQRAHFPEGQRAHTGSTEVDVGSLLQRYLKPAKELFRVIKKVSNPNSNPIALACRNQGKDAQIAIVGRREVHVGQISQGSFLTTAEKEWATLSPVAPAPLRAPLGSAVFRKGGISIGLSDRTHLLFTNDKLEVQSRSPRAYPLADGSCLGFTSSGLTPHAQGCPRSRLAPKLSARSVDAVERFAEPSSGEGVGRQVTLQLPTSGPAQLRVQPPSGSQATKTLPGLGHQILIGDLDGDGRAEIVSSSDQASGDHIQVSTLKKNGTLQSKKRLTTPTVHALAMCPFDGTNPRAIVAAVGKELWWIR